MKIPSWLVIWTVLSLVIGQLAGGRVHRTKRSPKSPTGLKNTEGKHGLAEMLAGLLPNTFYSRPKYRFPFYHKDGKECFITPHPTMTILYLNNL